MIGFLLKNKFVFSGALIVLVVLLGTIGVQRLNIGSLKNDLKETKLDLADMTTQRDTAVQVAADNAAAVEVIRLEAQRVEAVLDQARAADSSRQEIINNITKEVARAKRAECPASDSLSAAHSGLLKLAE